MENEENKWPVTWHIAVPEFELVLLNDSSGTLQRISEFRTITLKMHSSGVIQSAPITFGGTTRTITAIGVRVRNGFTHFLLENQQLTLTPDCTLDITIGFATKLNDWQLVDHF